MATQRKPVTLSKKRKLEIANAIIGDYAFPNASMHKHVREMLVEAIDATLTEVLVHDGADLNEQEQPHGN